ncbi:hypothetical protein B0H15DRAFT_38915 [Mycena belliarum]|uniref:4a-hydroxytetrahydrobiopterin dehydratase n=1 Tax=Mycena belliarum TaxID=1033014 RepID=A0AAD6TSB7_9AGAR|nr:hypothetical protein B0H15DRAFT_38915 [Mycena belliae]
MFSLRLVRSCVRKQPSGRRLLSDVAIPIPSKVKRWPTPWITEEDATDYLFPLYLYGWHVATVRNDSIRTAGLACRFAFPSFTPAAEFVRDILALVEAENHHPTLLNLSHSVKGSSLQICSTTHSALRPAWDATDTAESRALGGLTLRDLRFAALISSLPTSPTGPSLEIEPSASRPTWEDLTATLRKWSTSVPASSDKHTAAPCVACGGPHTISRCENRHSLPLPRCSICNGLHWRVDCPIRQTAQRNGTTVAKTRAKMALRIPREPSVPPSAPCPNCGGAHWASDCAAPPPEPCPNCGGDHWMSNCRAPNAPPQPCPNCGGDHWKSDCRAPHAPPNLLQRLALPVES